MLRMDTPLRSAGRAWRCAGRGELRQVAGALDQRHRARCGETPDHHVLAREGIRPSPASASTSAATISWQPFSLVSASRRLAALTVVPMTVTSRAGMADLADDQGADVDPHADAQAACRSRR